MMPRNPADGPSQNAALDHREENRWSGLSLQMNRKNQAQRASGRLVLRWGVREAFRVPIRANLRCERLRVASPASNGGRRFVLSRCLPFVVAVLFVGCSSPAVRQQRLVAKPNMLFSDSAAFSYNSPKLLPQLAPGFAGSGGAQNSGCTSCR
jgi:hypothetical protein